MTDHHEGDTLPVEARFFTRPDQEEPVSGYDLLELCDHDRAVWLLLRALRRGESGKTDGLPELTRIW